MKVFWLFAYIFSLCPVTSFRISNKRVILRSVSLTKMSAEIPKLMKAAFVNEHGTSFLVEDIDTPNPGPGKVLIKIVASGVCHTDIHAVDGDWPVKSCLPLIPGHEGAGVVVALGDGVKNLKVGDRVGVAWLHSACGECEYCESGWETLCPNQQNSGYSVNGCYGEYAIGTASHVIKIPDNIPFEQAAPLLCAGVTSYKGLKETETKAGEFCAIMGAAGGLGHLAIQYAKAMGFQVVAIDIGQEKLDYCKSLGADYAYDALSPSLVKDITEVTHGGCHGVLCLATQSNAFASSIKISRRKGTVVCVGLPPGSFATPIFEVVLKRITVRGSIVGTRKDLEETLDFAARGIIKCDIQLDSINNINNIFDKLRGGKVEGRIVLDMTGECACHPKTTTI